MKKILEIQNPKKKKKRLYHKSNEGPEIWLYGL